MQRLHGQDGVLTDQWRVYQEVVEKLSQSREPLRLCLQASAGTGKSFLLESIFLWCIIKGHTVREHGLGNGTSFSEISMSAVDTSHRRSDTHP